MQKERIIDTIQLLEGYLMELLILAIFIGACIASFMNAMIYRVPLTMEAEFKQEARFILGLPEEHTTLPGKRSQCPSCGTMIPLKYNIPILGWIMLKGKAACCGAPISPRYLINEIVGAILGYVIYTATNGDIPSMIFFGSLAALTMGLFWIDMDHQLLPDRMVVIWFILWLGGSLFHNSLAPTMAHWFLPLELTIQGFFFGFMSLLSISFVYKLVRGVDGMGMGDVKLLGVLGMMVGPYLLPYLFIAATASTLIVTIFARLFGKGKYNMVPFGPGLMFGAWLVYIAQHIGYLS